MQNEPLWCSYLVRGRKAIGSASLKGLSCLGSSSFALFLFPSLLLFLLCKAALLCSVLPTSTFLPYHSPTTRAKQTWTSLVTTQINLSSFDHGSQIFATATEFWALRGGGGVRTRCFHGDHRESFIPGGRWWVSTLPYPTATLLSVTVGVLHPVLSGTLSCWLAVYLCEFSPQPHPPLCFVCCLNLFFKVLQNGEETGAQDYGKY